LRRVQKADICPGLFERYGIQLPGSEKGKEERKKDTFIEITEYGLVGGIKHL
jgi:hypothetical protein